MPNSVKTLHDQNLRLRNEIQKLKNSLRELSTSSRRENPEPKETKLTDSQKENLIQNLKKQIEKAPVPLSKLQNLPPTGKPPSNNCSDRLSMRANKAVQDNLKKISKLTQSNPQPPDKHSRLLDSFQSYYESEEENLSKFGKCELSYIDYKKDHEKGSRRREKQMVDEIEKLKQENNCLKIKLKKVVGCKIGKLNKVVKSVTPRVRVSSRNSQKSSKSVRTCVSFVSSRRKHCRKCTALLAKGFSTVHCDKHGKGFR